jgi:hypothetical protein
MPGMLSTIKRLIKNLFYPSKYGSRIKLLFNKEKVSKSGKSSRMAFELEFERVDQNPSTHNSEENES